MPRGKRGCFEDITLDKWEAEAQKDNKQMVIEDKNDLVDAFHSIA